MGHGQAGGVDSLHDSLWEMTEDEVFVTADVAKEGVRIENPSATDPLVLLKHFGPGNPDAQPLFNATK